MEDFTKVRSKTYLYLSCYCEQWDMDMIMFIPVDNFKTMKYIFKAIGFFRYIQKSMKIDRRLCDSQLASE